MMNSYRHNNNKGRGILIFVTIIVVLLFAIDLFSRGSIRALVRTGATGMWEIGRETGDTIFGSGFFSSRRSLAQKNQALQDELSQLKVRSAAFEVLKTENESLRRIVSIVEEEDGITAPVVSSFKTSPYGTFMIGAGTEDGVQKGDLVIAGDPKFGGFVIGRVDDTDAYISLVKSIFAPGEITDAVVRDIGVSLEGRGGGQARGEIPREALVSEGDVIVSASVGARAIGIVGEVGKDSGEASQRLYVSLPISLSAIKFVYVVDK